MPPSRQLVGLEIRAMTRADFVRVSAVEHDACGDDAYTVERLADLFGQGCQGLVVVYRKSLVAHAIYYQIERRMHVYSIMVAPKLQREGIGSLLLDCFKSSSDNWAVPYTTIVDVFDHDLGVQQFLKINGFKALKVFRKDEGGDVYRFFYRRPWRRK